MMVDEQLTTAPPVLFSAEQTEKSGVKMVPLYAARLGDLGPAIS
jgi:hypothetical protein